MAETILSADFRWNKSMEELLKKFNLESGGLVQKAIDNAVIRWDEMYCPWDSGNLAMSAYTATVPGTGLVEYPGPYARYLYYGEVMGPNIPIFEDSSGEPTGFFSPPGQEKHLTGRPLEFSTDVNALAGPFWFERMKADHVNDILEEAKSVAGVK